LGNKQCDFQIHGFNTSENIAKSLWGYFFGSRCMFCPNLVQFGPDPPEVSKL